MIGPVPTSIHELLGDLRATALDKRDQGDRFERLIATYLRSDPEWTAKFEQVWLWPDWPGRDGSRDIGIDLVAKNRDDDGYSAIQCKFYDAGHKVSKADIDSFLAASMRPTYGFTRRYLFDTAAGWSGNAEEELVGVAQRVDIDYLNEAAFDWGAYDWKTPEVLVPTGKKTPRPHQQEAMVEVFAGLETNDRGKLIMACGTGKTFTSLKIAEHLAGTGKSVLFLVPSIQLLSQTLREWMAHSEVDIRPFAVCSDVRVGRKTGDGDDADMSAVDLTEPATTDAATLVTRMSAGKHATDRMTVVFSTYQSIDVIAQAQEAGLAEFDLIICDEAHRTTGATLKGAADSSFVKVHDNAYLRAAKRLYMTATPRVFGDDVRRKANEAEAVLADMDDVALFGPELHRLGFGEAVEADLLTDYKVLVLAVEENYIAENFQVALAESGEIRLDDAAKLIGCWNGLAKHFTADQTDQVDPAPMKTAVAFARDIKASQLAAVSFPIMVDQALQHQGEDDTDDDGSTAEAARNGLRVDARHVDGTMGIHERNSRLAWLKEDAGGGVCRILTNARCLSEGVDVPALDAVLFLTPRGSQVDVVQSVGRVMRKAPGKELGYIILPIVIPSGVAPEDALKDNERYKVVWQVLQALRSHDERFHAMINQIELNKKRSPKLVIDNVTPGEETENPDDGDGSEQMSLDLGFDGFRDAMYARIVQKVGERKYWESWAKDVADIAQSHIIRIKGLLADPASSQAKEFDAFLKGLRDSLNDSITAADAIDMLAQHLVTRPIFEALFEGYSFTETNPVARIMELMLASLDEHPLAAESAALEGFYESVRRRVAGVDNAEGKQRILIELYDKFFAAAFKKTVDKLGIVYTPVEIVDFILRSADDVLRAEFGQGLTDEGVHILDPFTGTGTFLVRLLQSGLIEKHDLARKYASEIHGNEMLLLAYYIATVNIETTYADLAGELTEFPGLVLTDTFQSWEPDDVPDLGIFVENTERLRALKELPITVIVGNPPYSAGQESADDDNQNESYPSLDGEIEKTYAAASSATSKRTLYDSYIRAIKWATLRVQDRGVIAYITNGGFLDSNSADGLRKTLAEEFSSIYIYNLRGNQRTAGEQSRKEGGKIFGGGSRATVAITLLVKDTSKTGAATIHYTDIGDYLSREAKLAKVAEAGTISQLTSATIEPNVHGDWLGQRREDFETFLGLSEAGGLFTLGGPGITTNRDLWVYGWSSEEVDRKVKILVEAYSDAAAGSRVDDPRRISWSRGLRQRAARGEQIAWQAGNVRRTTYRPFTRQQLYLSAQVNEIPGQTPRMFPSPTSVNTALVVIGPRLEASPAVLAVDGIADLSFFSYGAHVCSRWRYEQVEGSGMLDLGGDGEVIDGYRRVDNISDEALKRFHSAYPGEVITKDDIFFYVYGLLHSSEYREAYAADLKKMLPRIPFVADFHGFAEAGRRLSELHLGYESVEPYPLDGLAVQPSGDPYEFFAVGAKKMTYGKATAEQKAAGEKHDRTVIRYNDRITLSGIPLEAYQYMIGSRSAVEWIIDRYYVKTDKASGIVNDPNEWSREIGDPRYILDLIARIVMLSLETMKIVDSLPALTILDAAE
ncbi:DEAD/DEAH box helicase family protein [Nocardioides sp. NBC_00368]|uniref:DEAD/DEAH box helicase n=1 Tax=Nocardioides sp. NBC_00368 TaxID=2976000 RepID=UPI002E20AEA3